MNLVIDRSAQVGLYAPNAAAAAVPPAPAAHRPPHLRRRVAGENGLVVATAFTLYLTGAILLDFRFRIFPLDAVSRMANGYYVIWSHDPHLAAVGFVWSPLQSFADIPFLLFRPLWPALSTHDFAGSLVTVLAGVGAVHQVHAALREWEVRRLPRLLLTLIFAINPMILYYSVNGMSDALYIFLLVATTRYLLRWLRHEDLRSLVYAGTALGLAYLDRYEAIGAAGLSSLVVIGATFFRTTGPRRARVMTALNDIVIFLLPLATTFVAWATMSFVITGQAFPGITSQYGTTAQNAADIHFAFAARVSHDVLNLEYLAPLLPVVLVVAIVASRVRRDIGILAPLAVLGGSLAFNALGVLSGTLEPWYRYFIAGVPLDVLLIGCIVACGRAGPAGATTSFQMPPVRSRPVRAFAEGTVAVLIVVIGAVPSVPSSGLGIFAHGVRSSESVDLGALLLAHPNQTAVQFSHHYRHIGAIDTYLARMNLPSGSVVADTFGQCTPQIVSSVPDERIFVITNDRDFQKVVADPLTFHAHYLFVPQPVGVGLADALNVAHAGLYDNGGGFATLVHEFSSDGICAVYRLYRVTGHPGQ